MCMFSGSVEDVSHTRIFARRSARGQYIVYRMNMAARRDVAMILPLPVPPNSADDAVRWIDLKLYPEFFTDVDRCFASPVYLDRSMAMSGSGAGGLAVVQVGNFEASFVPSLPDFERLDARFRLPADVWRQLPSYRRWGFAVFKLKPGNRSVHPMAFEFPRADPRGIFFPTLHVHDGEVHATADFDHTLYCQRNPGQSLRLAEWEESRSLAGLTCDCNRASGALIIDQHCYRRRIAGEHRNDDVWVQ